MSMIFVCEAREEKITSLCVNAKRIFFYYLKFSNVQFMRRTEGFGCVRVYFDETFDAFFKIKLVEKISKDGKKSLLPVTLVSSADALAFAFFSCSSRTRDFKKLFLGEKNFRMRKYKFFLFPF